MWERNDEGRKRLENRMEETGEEVTVGRRGGKRKNPKERRVGEMI